MVNTKRGNENAYVDGGAPRGSFFFSLYRSLYFSMQVDPRGRRPPTRQGRCQHRENRKLAFSLTLRVSKSINNLYHLVYSMGDKKEKKNETTHMYLCRLTLPGLAIRPDPAIFSFLRVQDTWTRLYSQKTRLQLSARRKMSVFFSKVNSSRFYLLIIFHRSIIRSNYFNLFFSMNETKKLIKCSQTRNSDKKFAQQMMTISTVR